MSLFGASQEELDALETIDEQTLQAPEERLKSPKALRTNYEKGKEDDGDSAYNRALVQGQMDFVPPHDEKELLNKGQGDRFNLTTGEGVAIKNEAVAAYMDIYTTPKILADIPLLPEVDEQQAADWSSIMAEEYTIMDRDDDSSLALHLQLADTYVTHGIAVGYFDDKSSMQYSVAGLDHFKFPRKTKIISSSVEFCTALGHYTAPELYAKIGTDGWDEEMIKLTIIQAGSDQDLDDWNDWEEVQRKIKGNELYVDSICSPIEVIHGWVKEFNGKVSYYVCSRHGTSPKEGDREGDAERFLFKAPDYYDSIEQVLQIFPFSVGNGGRLYTVRGLGYLIYQLCNAMDIMHCKLLDNARIGSSLLVQPASTEDAQDMMLIDFGGGVALPPNMRLPEKQISQNLNNSLIPAINESRNIINRATGGLAGSNQILNPQNDRQTKLEVSSKLDYINKLNSFAINLFYGPYDKITKEKIRRAFTVLQSDKAARERVRTMKSRCIARGVPAEIFKMIDFKRVRASRIIGTGSRSSRIMLMDQMQQMYSTWDAVGRANFEYDYLVELVGVDKADRYAGKPQETRLPYDHQIAKLENFELLEGDYLDPLDSEMKMVHIPIHIEELEAGLIGVDEGKIDLIEWTMEHQMLYQHLVATIEITTVHEQVQPELNTFVQRSQQIGEIVVNGMKMINKQAREEGEAEGQDGEGEDESEQNKADKAHQQDMQRSDQKHKQDLQQNMEVQLQKLQFVKQAGEQKQVMAAQEAMGKVAMKDAEIQQRLRELRARSI